MTTLEELRLERLQANLETLGQSITSLRRDLADQVAEYAATQRRAEELRIAMTEAEQADQSPEE